MSTNNKLSKRFYQVSSTVLGVLTMIDIWLGAYYVNHGHDWVFLPTILTGAALIILTAMSGAIGFTDNY